MYDDFDDYVEGKETEEDKKAKDIKAIHLANALTLMILALAVSIRISGLSIYKGGILSHLTQTDWLFYTLKLVVVLALIWGGFFLMIRLFWKRYL